MTNQLAAAAVMPGLQYVYYGWLWQVNEWTALGEQCRI